MNDATARAGDGSAERVAALERVSAMIDPPDRYYRYPVSEWLVNHVVPTGTTPNQITMVHALLGIAAACAVWRGSRAALVCAAVLWELHLVLDCLDGVLARARERATAHGRFLDILGDTVAYLALAAAMYDYVRATHPGFPAGVVTSAMIASGALAAWAHDFYRRKLTAALLSGTDEVYETLLARHRVVASGRAGFVDWFGYVFEWLQVVGFQLATVGDIGRRLRAATPPPAPGTSPEARAIVAAADTPSARRAFRAVALMSNDNDVTILGLGLLTGQVLAGQIAAAVFATVSLVAGVVVCQAFLREARARC